jgi:hypothetical protein
MMCDMDLKQVYPRNQSCPGIGMEVLTKKVPEEGRFPPTWKMLGGMMKSDSEVCIPNIKLTFHHCLIANCIFLSRSYSRQSIRSLERNGCS